MVSARDLAGAERGVVRAVSESRWVTVTDPTPCRRVSAPATGLPYDRRLSGLSRIVQPIGGRAEVWSEEGRGVRVTLVVPAADGVRRTGRRTPARPRASHTSWSGTEQQVTTMAPSTRVTSTGEPSGGSSADRSTRSKGSGRSLTATPAPAARRSSPARSRGRLATMRTEAGGLHRSRMAASRSPVLVRNDPIPSDGEDGWLDEATQANRTDRGPAHVVAGVAGWSPAWPRSWPAAGAIGARSLAVGQLVGVAPNRCGWPVILPRQRLSIRSPGPDGRSGHGGGRSPGRSGQSCPRGPLDVDRLGALELRHQRGGRARRRREAPMAGALGATVIIGTGASLAGAMERQVGQRRWHGRPLRRGQGVSSARFAMAAPASRRPGRKPSTRAAGWPSNRSARGSCGSSTTAPSRRWRRSGPVAIGDLPSIRLLALAEAGRLGDELEGTAPRARSLGEELEALVDRARPARAGRSTCSWAGRRSRRPPVLLALRDACNEALVNVGKHAGTAGPTSWSKTTMPRDPVDGGRRPGGRLRPVARNRVRDQPVDRRAHGRGGREGPDRIGARTRDTGASVGTGDDHRRHRRRPPRLPTGTGHGRGSGHRSRAGR